MPIPNQPKILYCGQRVPMRQCLTKHCRLNSIEPSDSTPDCKMSCKMRQSIADAEVSNEPSNSTPYKAAAKL